MATPIFVVGTGRCGSTLLSNLIREHQWIASISEFYSLASDLGARFPELFPSEPLDGAELWQLIGIGYPRSNLMIRHDVAMPEVIYPYRDGSARFNRETGVPVVLQATLPHLSDTFDSLYDELGEFVRSLPRAPARTQYQALFTWLQERHGRKVWIERSGGIFNIMQQIYDTFPEGKYVHIVRDGRNTAISMNVHRGFRMFVLGQFLSDCLGVDPYYSDDRTRLNRIPRQYRAFLPENFQAESFDRFRFPLSMMGRLWSGQILRGLEVLDKVPADHLLTIRYEDLVSQPRGELTRLAEFLGDDFVHQDWLDRCAPLVRPAGSQWEVLPEKEQATLMAACQPGFEALRQRGISYDV